MILPRNKLVFFVSMACAVLILGACFKQPKSGLSLNKKAASVSAPASYATEMTLAMFKERVMDYEKNPGEWKYKGTRPAIIDFYATWCGPCRLTSPVLDSLSVKYEGRIDVYKVDVDKERELASMFAIQSIPAFLFIPVGGQPVMQVGAMSREDFERITNETLLP